MSNLSKLTGETKEIEVEGIKIILHPLRSKDALKFSKQDTTDEEKAKMSTEILKLSIPDATEEEIGNLPLKAFTELMEEINKLNGFTDESVDKIRALKHRTQRAK